MLKWRGFFPAPGGGETPEMSINCRVSLVAFWQHWHKNRVNHPIALLDVYCLPSNVG
jgi:hypothetical protein